MTLSEDGERIRVAITNPEIATLTEVVYAWVGPNHFALRVGTAMHPVGPRLRLYEPHINKSLDNRPSPTPRKEADGWIGALREGPVVAVMHQPPLIETAAGVLRPYLNMERQLIRSLRPPFNRTHN